MGHRKYSAPRRGSIAFRPRARAKSIEARIRNWTLSGTDRPNLAGFAGFKAGVIQVLAIDDREKTPNYGKHLVSPGTVLVTPPIRIIGIRAYSESQHSNNVLCDAYSRELPKDLKRKLSLDTNVVIEDQLTKMNGASSVVALVAISPRDADLAQKKPFVFEVAVSGKDVKSKLEYLKTVLGKEIRINDVFQVGQFIDVSAISRGKGIEGPITRFGVKRKQHKSRKSVRAVGTLGPISPAVVMYTVPRQGQRGFHQRTEYNKRILLMSSTNSTTSAISRSGGFKHFGVISSDYIVLKGSVPGVPKRLIKLRQPIRNYQKKLSQPKILEVVVE
jgi:large subunit ribosomal protein L3